VPICCFRDFIRGHKVLRVTPTESVGSRTSAMTVGDIVNLMDACTDPPKKRGNFKPSQSRVAA